MSTTPIEDPSYDVCLWPVDPACLTEEWNALPEPDRKRALALATATLRRLTAYRVGGCPITVRPCKRSCAAQYGGFYGQYGTPGFGWHPHVNLEGNWVNSCGCETDCSCTALCSIALPGPIGRLDAVLVGTEDITAQVKVAGNEIFYTGPEDCPFPACQDMTAEPGTEGAFAVTYLNSYPVDGLGAYAAGTLAMEYALACSGQKCRLPKGVTSISRQGVNIEVVSGAFPSGMTGINEVDAFIALWRPEGSPKIPPTVWSPGTRTPRVIR